ncbi:ABC transporter ATP-binding protein NatA [bacterium HR18]|nr:ABC transporter ATP-binding protein NatA [bacterium HR18]
MHCLEVIGLGKRFGFRRLFSGLSFRLKPGEQLAVTGPNGSGKSTLVRILAGVLRPTEGSVVLQVNGKTLEATDRPLHVGLVAPYVHLYDGFTARENLMFLARARGLDNPQKCVEVWLDRVALRLYADEPVAVFSSGMRQRLRFAAALLADPVLWLLDEPRANLDEAGRHLVATLLEQGQRQGRLIVVATNEAGEAAACDRQLYLPDYRAA